MSLHCSAFDLLLQTDVSIPGALPALEAGAGSQAVPDLIVCTGHAALSAEWKDLASYRTGPEGLLFQRPGIARFLCSAMGNHITVDVVPGVSLDAASPYLIATALPAALWMRNDLLLHGAAAVFAGASRATAMLGPSGSGKSALLRAIVQDGGAVVAEDSVCLRSAGDAYRASGLPACLHLRLPGAALTAERRMQVVPAAQRLASATLGAVVILEPKENVRFSILERLSSEMALVALLRCRHRPRVPQLLGLDGALLPRWAAMARSVPVYFWKFPADACDHVEPTRLWRELARAMSSEERASA